MGFRCSVLGHRFEEPGLVNEREQRGDEVIATKRKIMVCTICGEQRVLAERKEITSQTHPSTEDDGKEQHSSGDCDDATTTVAPDDPAAQGQPSDADQASVASDPPALPTPDSASASGWSSRSRPMDGTNWHPGQGERASTGTGTGTGTGSNADPGTDTEQFAAVAQDDGEILDSSANSAGSVVDDRTSQGGYPSTASLPERPEELLVCSDCGFAVQATDSAFRAGDICPECHTAYLSASTG